MPERIPGSNLPGRHLQSSCRYVAHAHETMNNADISINVCWYYVYTKSVWFIYIGLNCVVEILKELNTEWNKELKETWMKALQRRWALNLILKDE